MVCIVKLNLDTDKGINMATNMNNYENNPASCGFCGFFDPNFDEDALYLHCYRECPMVKLYRVFTKYTCSYLFAINVNKLLKYHQSIIIFKMNVNSKKISGSVQDVKKCMNQMNIINMWLKKCAYPLKTLI